MMTAYTSFEAVILTRIVITLGHFLWQGAVIAAVAFLLSSLLRKSSARFRYAIFLSLFVLMAVSPVVTYRYVPVPAAAGAVTERDALPDGGDRRSAAGIPSTAFRSAAETPPSSLAEPNPVAPPPIDAVPGESPTSSNAAIPTDEIPVVSMKTDFAANPMEDGIRAESPGRWQWTVPYLAGAYLFGVIVLLGRLLLGLDGGRRLRRQSLSIDDPLLLSAIARRVKALGMRVAPTVLFCRKVTVPTVVGVFRPAVLLPLAFTSGLSMEQVEAVLTHEFAHLRRYDHLVNLLQRVVEAVLFFHPVVWWVSRCIRVERENCCDDVAVLAGFERLEYAASLVEIAERGRAARTSHRSTALAALHAADGSALGRRIQRLVNGASSESFRLTRGGIAGVLLLIGLMAYVGQIAVTRSGADATSIQTNADQAKLNHPRAIVATSRGFTIRKPLTNNSGESDAANAAGKRPIADEQSQAAVLRRCLHGIVDELTQYRDRYAEFSEYNATDIKQAIASIDDHPLHLGFRYEKDFDGWDDRKQPKIKPGGCYVSVAFTSLDNRSAIAAMSVPLPDFGVQAHSFLVATKDADPSLRRTVLGIVRKHFTAIRFAETMRGVDAKIRSGLLELSKQFPQLRTTNHGPLARRLKGHSAHGEVRISVGLYPKGPGKSDGTTEPVPKNDEYGVHVILKPSGGPTGQLSLSAIYPGIGIEGSVRTSANDPKLKAALEKLVADSLLPLQALDRKTGGSAPMSARSANESEAGQAVYGPVFEHPFRTPRGKEPGHLFLDLDTWMSSGPVTGEMPNEFPGADIDVDLSSQRMPARRAASLRTVKIEEGLWNLSAADALKRLAEAQESNAASKGERVLSEVDILATGRRREPRPTYLFQTARNRVGVLQFAGHVDAPRTIKFRCKRLLTQQELAAWSAPVDGFRVRVRADKLQWSTTETPVIKLDLWNDTDREVQYNNAPFDCTIEYDGRVYRWADTVVYGGPVQSIEPRHARNATFRFSLDRSWAQTDEPFTERAKAEDRLNLAPGDHAVRVTIHHPVKLTSNPLEFEIRDRAVGEWGNATNRVQSRLVSKRRTWPTGAAPELQVELRQQGDQHLLLDTSTLMDGCFLEVDGVRFRRGRGKTGEDQLANYHGSQALISRLQHEHRSDLQSGWFPTLVLDDGWVASEKTLAQATPLRLTAGAHSVRFVWRGYVPGMADGRKPDFARPVTLTTGRLSLWIVKSADGPDRTEAKQGGEWGNPVDGVDRNPVEFTVGAANPNQETLNKDPFDSVIERTVPDISTRNESFIDFDTNKLLAPPADLDLGDSNAVQTFLFESGADARADVRGVKGLANSDMWAWVIPLPAEAWDRRDLMQVLEGQLSMAHAGRVHFQAGDDSDKPATYGFRTQAGAVGILQVLALTDEPKGVTIRFKLLKQPATAGGGLGRIEGTVTTGMKPQADLTISLLERRDPDRRKNPENWYSTRRYATTDKNGRFVFDGVRPGVVQLEPRVLNGEEWDRMRTQVIVRPGATAKVVLGGRGRPVIGRLMPPADLKAEIDWSQCEVSLVNPAAPWSFELVPNPAAPFGFENEGATIFGNTMRARRAFLSSEMGKVYLPRTARVKPDGSFRFERVPSGTCPLVISVPASAVQPADGETGSVKVSLKKYFSVGAMESEESTVPLDLGELEVSWSRTQSDGNDAAGARGSASDAGQAAAQAWGTLRGRFVFDGTPPKPQPLDIRKESIRDGSGRVAVAADRFYHDKDIKDESLVVDKDGVANVVIYVRSADLPIHPDYQKTADAPVTLLMKDGRFQPHVTVMRTRQPLRVKNVDPVVVNFHPYWVNSEPIHVILRQNQEFTHRLVQEDVPMRIGSDIHDWMRGYVLARENPYFAVTDKDGRFEIRNLPVGEWEFQVWHEELRKSIQPANWPRTRFKLAIKTGSNQLRPFKFKARPMAEEASRPAGSGPVREAVVRTGIDLVSGVFVDEQLWQKSKQGIDAAVLSPSGVDLFRYPRITSVRQTHELLAPLGMVVVELNADQWSMAAPQVRRIVDQHEQDRKSAGPKFIGPSRHIYAFKTADSVYGVVEVLPSDDVFPKIRYRLLQGANGRPEKEAASKTIHPDITNIHGGWEITSVTSSNTSFGNNIHKIGDLIDILHVGQTTADVLDRGDLSFLKNDRLTEQRHAGHYPFVLDPTSSPKKFNIAFDKLRLFQRGIYRLDDYALTLCVGPPGGERPGSFDVQEGGHRCRLVLSRVTMPPSNVGWGKPVEGVQVRLRPKKATWTTDEIPAFVFDVSNQGRRAWSVAQAQQLHQILVDGRRYRWIGQSRVRSSAFPPSRGYFDIPVTLTQNWERITDTPEAGDPTSPPADDGADNRPLKLAPGKHTIQLIVLASSATNAGDDVRATSRSVEIEIVSKDAVEPKPAEASWGKPVDGLRFRWLPLNGPVKAGSQPKVRVQVQNVSDNVIVWECEAASTWKMRRDAKHGWTMPRFEVMTSNGVRVATADSVRTKLKIDRDRVRSGPRQPEFYELEPRATLTLTASLPWKLDADGPLQLETRLCRYTTQARSGRFLESPDRTAAGGAAPAAQKLSAVQGAIGPTNASRALTCPQLTVEVAQDGSPDAKTGRKPVATQLASGVTVELVGVAEAPSKGGKWWGPAGRELMDGPYNDDGTDILSNADPVTRFVELAFRLSGESASEAHYIVNHSSVPMGIRKKDGKPLPDILSFAVTTEPDQKTLDLSWKIATGKWRTIAECSPDALIAGRAPELLVQLQADDGSTTLVTKWVDSGEQERAIAINEDGKQHVGTQLSAGGGPRRWLWRFEKLAPANIRMIRLQTRSFDLIELRNISLKAGHTTNARIVSGRPANQPGAERRGAAAKRRPE